ncbi:hypothetical protein CPB83DRAFT_910519 [Crepidotus variabilis]|uniref:Vacuolar protein sorting-associated protein 27 n=1 Tax=Crepidotus variabilis TaxID=179855 RepID=A0A9P6E6R1_9AGAR|nr:hypothetical protein CPB83DRAFT_910519 [Crepidotus variabilis]
MSGLGAWIWGTSQLDDAIDKATSELMPAATEDIALNLEICDQIRSKSAPAKDAMRALKRRLNHKNPNVQLLTLTLTDVCVKNGGDLFLSEVASREFMDNLVSILKVPALNHEVKTSLLRHIQNWSIAFEGKPSLNYVNQVYKTLLNEGYKFPPKDLSVANSAMVDTQTAPEWIDSEVCLRCRTAFSFTNRKHHCRNCGQVFDQACSSKNMPLPHFGIAQEVRVCDGCHSKLSKKAEKADKAHKHHQHSNRHKSAKELADAELQRAIELSLQEVNGTSHRRPGYVPSQPSTDWYSEPPIVDRITHPTNRKPATIQEEEDPDLKAAIEASLREANAPKPSAPVGLETPKVEQGSYNYNTSNYSQSAYVPTPSQPPLPSLPKIPTYDLEPLETDVILTFNQTVEQVQAQGGRDLSRYPAVTELYEKATGLRPKLALSLDDAGRKEEILSEMHEKLSQAVKLYDQILTQQVSQPRWRAPVATGPVSPGAYQQQQQQSYASPSIYSQWAPQQVQYQPTPEAPMTVASPPPAQPQWHQQQPVSVAYQSEPQPAQYTHPVQSSSYTQHSYAAPQSPPPPQQYQTPTPQVPSFQPQPSSPLISSLGRHNTVSYAPSPSSIPSPPSPQLARSNTLSSASTNQYQQHVPQPMAPDQPPPQLYQGISARAQPQQQQYQHQQPSVSLSQFPVAPTSAPQPTYSMYTPPVPSGFEQKEERKEALLIDL